MSVGFWSAVIKPGKKHEFQPPEGFVLNLQNVALQGGEKGTAFSIFVETEPVIISEAKEKGETKTLIATLRSHVTDQFQTAMVFGYDVPVSFSVASNGEKSSKAEVHLGGYIQPGPLDDDGEDDEDMYGMYGGYPMVDDLDGKDSSSEDDSEMQDQAMLSMVTGDDSDDDGDDDNDDDYDDDAVTFKNPRVEELPSDDDGKPPKTKTKQSKKRKVDESDYSDDDEGNDTPSDVEDIELDDQLINKMIKRHGVKTGGSDGGSATKKKPEGRSSAGKKNKKGKGRGK